MEMSQKSKTKFIVKQFPSRSYGMDQNTGHGTLKIGCHKCEDIILNAAAKIEDQASVSISCLHRYRSCTNEHCFICSN